jgi:RHS repeat-associated protein
VEFEESLGLNLYEMDMRQYDPAIARWTSIDPVTHFSMSTYTAFDNNPIYWSDPSGADSWGPDYDQNDCCGDEVPMQYLPEVNLDSNRDNISQYLPEVNLDSNRDNISKYDGWVSDYDGGSWGMDMDSWKTYVGYEDLDDEQARARYRDEYGGSYNVYERSLPNYRKQYDRSRVINLGENFKSNWNQGRMAWSKGPQGSGTAEFAEKLAVFGVGGAMALPVASVAGPGLLSLGAQSTETASLTYSMMFRNGIMRLAVRNSLGRFAVGNGTRLTGSVFSQYYGLNGLGQATQFTPLVSRSIPVLVRWVIGLGGTGGITYWGYQKIIN